MYGHGSSEQIVGHAIKEYTRREDIVLATKLNGKMSDGPGGQGLSRRAVMEQVDASLTRLGTDFQGRPLFLDSDKDIVDAVQAIAESRGVSMATVGLAWVLKNDVVAAPIVGATKEKHLTDAAAALEIELTVDELVRLEEPYAIRQPTYF